MALTDPIADMLTRIRNGQKARLAFVTSPSSKMRINVLEVLKREGYIRDFSAQEVRKGISELKIELKYENGRPVIKRIERVSTPGRRVYSPISDLDKYLNGLGTKILSTAKGVMSDYEARVANVGGEVICKLF